MEGQLPMLPFFIEPIRIPFVSQIYNSPKWKKVEMRWAVFLPYLAFWIFGFFILWKIPTPRIGKIEDPQADLSVIIPARNEERNLGRLLSSLSRQTLKPREIIVVDDHSSDSTPAIAKGAGCKVLPSADLPGGWTGKSWACWQGAKTARERVLLFLDADTFLNPEGLRKIVATFWTRRGLLSVQPFHSMEKAYERLAAIFNIIVLVGANVFSLGGSKRKPFGAFGPCYICLREDYFSVGGHQAVKGDILESVGLGKEFLKNGLPVHCYGGRGSISFRMYSEGVKSLVEGFGKGFGSGAQAMNFTGLILAFLWISGGMGVTRQAIQSLALGGSTLLAGWILLYLLYALQYHWMLRRIGNFGILTAFLFPIPLLFFGVIFLLSLLRTFFFRKVQWKGRSISTNQGRQS
jgi:4,4'-diaponeurosporenoate glycosyltransferase